MLGVQIFVGITLEIGLTTLTGLTVLALTISSLWGMRALKNARAKRGKAASDVANQKQGVDQ